MDRNETVSMDGGVSVARALIQRPDRYGSFYTSSGCLPPIARGAGFSFAAASFGSKEISIDFTAFDRILDFEDQTGPLKSRRGLRCGHYFNFLLGEAITYPYSPVTMLSPLVAVLPPTSMARLSRAMERSFPRWNPSDSFTRGTAALISRVSRSRICFEQAAAD